MTPAARIAAIIDMLDEVLTQPRPADSILSDYFRARKFIGSKDRTALASTIYAVLRHFLRLSWHLGESYAAVSGRYLMLAYLRLVDGKSPGEISDWFTGERYAPARLTAEETRWLAGLPEYLEPRGMPQNVRIECPDEYVEGFKAALGDDFETEMRALLNEAPLDVRSNPLVISRTDAVSELRKHGIEAAATALSPLGIRITKRAPLQTLDLFKRGGIEVQDEGSQLIALLLGAQPGDAVVDFCAGAGGKTLAIAAQMQNKGRVVACDVLARRLERAKVRFVRAKLGNIQTRALSHENDKWVKRNAGIFDRVLVDAPCSGTGTWRRNPDARWKHLGPGLMELLPLQASILASAARLLKPGGRLVYATCSMLPDENQNQVAKFLELHPTFKLVPMANVWEASVGNAMPSSFSSSTYLSLSPARDGTDGFFAAVLQNAVS